MSIGGRLTLHFGNCYFLGGEGGRGGEGRGGEGGVDWGLIDTHFVGGEGGEGGGVDQGSIDTHFKNCHFLGGGRGGGCQSGVNRHSLCRWGGRGGEC